MAFNNIINANSSGLQSLSTTGVWTGRTLTAGTGISISNGDGISGNPTISSSGDGLSWSETSGSFSALAEHGYSLTGAATPTMPASPATGDTILFQCNTASAVAITAAGSQILRLGNQVSSAGGTLTSTAIGDVITLTYSATNTVWIARGTQGNWAVA